MPILSVKCFQNPRNCNSQLLYAGLDCLLGTSFFSTLHDLGLIGIEKEILIIWVNVRFRRPRVLVRRNNYGQLLLNVGKVWFSLLLVGVYSVIWKKTAFMTYSGYVMISSQTSL